jgi:large subunit ribosomal protein L2
MKRVDSALKLRTSGRLVKPCPVTPGLRHYIKVDRKGLGPNTPQKTLVRGQRRGSGRNNQGRITVRHRGGGHKRKYRTLSLRMDQKANSFGDGLRSKVLSIEYDPNRSAWLALLRDDGTGRLRYVIATHELEPKSYVWADLGENTVLPIGTNMKLSGFSVGDQVHSIEMSPGRGAKMVRSAGCYAQVLHQSASNNLVRVRLPSGEERFFSGDSRAVLGQVSNPSHRHRRLGKAGRSRWLGRRPGVRGVAMNPFDHPHGGGEGKTSGARGRRSSRSAWGVPTKGHTTRKKGWPSSVAVPRKRGWEGR